MAEQLSDISTVERAPKIEGKNMVTMLLPKADHDKTEKNADKNIEVNNSKEEANHA
jgi:translation initiation factor IF-3